MPDMGARARRAGAILCLLAGVFLAAVALPAQLGDGKGDAGTVSAASSQAAGSAPTVGAAQGPGESLRAETVARRILFGEAAAAIAALAGQSAGGGEASLPAGFEDEVLAVSGFADVLANPQAKAVGWSCAGTASEAFALVSADLRVRGWHAVESGMARGGTFFKEEGEYRWVFVMCYQIGESASVVLQYG